MSPLDNLVAIGMGSATAFMGEPITVDGKPYTAVVNRFQLTRAMMEAGSTLDFDLVAVISRTQMPNVPANGTSPLLGTYQGRQVRVESSDTDEAAVTLYLREVS